METELKNRAISIVRLLESEVLSLAFEVKTEWGQDADGKKEINRRTDRAMEQAKELMEIIKNL